MSAVQPRSWTLTEFLDWEERQPTKYEFDGVRPIAMTGGTAAHAGIQGNLFVAIRGRLRGQPCQFYGSELKIEVAGRIRYPDGFVVCTPVPPTATIIRDPVVIFEVLSKRTATTDFVAKNDEYAATPSVRRYIMLAQDRMGGVMFERLGDDWVGHILAPRTIFRMPEIGIEVPISEFYTDIKLTPEEDEE